MIGSFIKLSVQTIQPLIVIIERGILSIIIGYVQQFIDHCLIPLDLFRLTIHSIFFSSPEAVSTDEYPAAGGREGHPGLPCQQGVRDL